MATAATVSRARRVECDRIPSLWDEESVESATPSPIPAGASQEGGPTLDDRISELWDRLVASTTIACPLCATEMRPRWSAGAGVVGGLCPGCATTLE